MKLIIFFLMDLRASYYYFIYACWTASSLLAIFYSKLLPSLKFLSRQCNFIVILNWNYICVWILFLLIPRIDFLFFDMIIVRFFIIYSYKFIFIILANHFKWRELLFFIFLGYLSFISFWSFLVYWFIVLRYDHC